MRDIFVFLIQNIRNWGNITTANLYDGNFSTIDFETDKGNYTITVRFEKKKEEEKENA